MANVPTQLSPGVNFTEIDLSGIIRESGNNTAGIVGQFRWGPASEILTIDNERRLTETFLQPTNILPEKMQDDFFNVVNFLRYSDKLRIVRVVSENAKNAAAGQDNTFNRILIHNDEEFFALADPQDTGARNYGQVIPQANWIARYPGDVGNSIEVRVVGSGIFVEGSTENPPGECQPPSDGCPPDFEWDQSLCQCVEVATGGSGGGGEGGGDGGGGGVPTGFSLPLISNGEPLPGVTWAIVTVPQVVEMANADFLSVAMSGFTFAGLFVGGTGSKAGGNTFGIKYLCFFLSGSSYCGVSGSFPIPGGSYSYISGSNATGGLTYSAFYRDRWFYGTFGTEEDNTDGINWTQPGPLLAARLGIELIIGDGGETFGRGMTYGKGFHQCSQRNFHAPTSGLASKGIPQRLVDGFMPETGDVYKTVDRVTAISSLNYAADAMAGYWPTNQWLNDASGQIHKSPWCLEIPADKDIKKPFPEKPFTSISNCQFTQVEYFSTLTFPSFVVLPLDNTASSLTEPYTNIFRTSNLEYKESSTIKGIPLAGLTMQRTASNYMTLGSARGVIGGISGGTYESKPFDYALTPLKPVIEAFGNAGITATGATGAKGMILMFAFAQNVTGITSGLMSLWRQGMTNGSSLGQYFGSIGVTLNIGLCDGNNANAATRQDSTNIYKDDEGDPFVPPNNINVSNPVYGFEAEFDSPFLSGIASFNIDLDTSVVNPSVGLTFSPSFQDQLYPVYMQRAREGGGMAAPFIENEIPKIIDLSVLKRQS